MKSSCTVHKYCDYCILNKTYLNESFADQVSLSLWGKRDVGWGGGGCGWVVFFKTLLCI